MRQDPPELVCVLVPDFALQVARAGVEGPCVLAARADASARVLAVDPELVSVGVCPGQTVAQARALHAAARRAAPAPPSARRTPRRPDPARGLVVLTPRPEVVRRAHVELLEALHRIAPGLESIEDGVVFVSPADLRRLEPDVVRLGRRLAHAAAQRGFVARVGIGRGRYVARLAALRNDAPEPALVADGPAFLAPLGLGCLPLPAPVRDAMAVLGLETLGDLQKLSSRQVLDRWGAEALVAWRLARGDDDVPLRAWRPPRIYARDVEFEDGIRGADELVFALLEPLERLLDEMRRHGERAEALTIDLERDRGDDVTLVLGLEGGGGPAPSARSLLALMRLELDRLHRRSARGTDRPAGRPDFTTEAAEGAEQRVDPREERPPTLRDLCALCGESCGSTCRPAAGAELAVMRVRLRVGRAPRMAGLAIEDLAWGFFPASRGPRSRARGAARDAQAPNLFARRREACEPLAVTLARLRARLGDEALGRVELRPAVRPEATWRRVPLGRRGGDGAGGWGTPGGGPPPTPPHPATPANGDVGQAVDLLPLPAGRTLRLIPGGPRAVAAPGALRSGPCTLSGEWWADGFDREYYLAVGETVELVFFDRGRGRWFVQGEVD